MRVGVLIEVKGGEGGGGRWERIIDGIPDHAT